MSEHDNSCDYNNSSLCARALLHDFPVRCTCGVDEHNQRERDERRRRVFSSKCSCTWTKRVSWSGALCPPCAALTTLASNLAIGAALCRAFRTGGAVALDAAMGIYLHQWRPGCGRNAP